MAKNSPVMRETWDQSLGQEDSLEKGMATHSCILAWRIPWTGEPDGLQSVGAQRVRHDLATNTFKLLFNYHLLPLHKVVKNYNSIYVFTVCKEISSKI